MPVVRVVLATVALAFGAPSQAQERVEYQPPVDGAPVETFRPPVNPYGPGNRGVDYATDLDEPVRAAAAGDVVFAGTVGHGRHVVVRHADGVRTSYSFLATITTRRGARVERGEAVGTAGTRFHFGARIGDAYVDPLVLFGRGARHAHLVDDDEREPSSPAEERRSLVDLLRDIGGTRGEWEPSQRRCTPAAQPPPPVPPHVTRRRAILVGGLGSSTDNAAILAVDTAALGYIDTDVEQFTYRADGGAYTPTDTQQDIATSARLLADHIARRHREDPHTPIDVFAHSQGGLVARAALANHPEQLDGVATIVTIGTPHSGNTLAAGALRLDDESDLAAIAFALARRAGAGDIDPTSASVGQLATGSDFLLGLDSARTPPDTTLRSIAASTDAVVPAASATWPGADNITVDLAGPPTATDHARLPGDPTVTRELALAIARLPPTCVSFDSWRRRRAVGGVVEAGQRHLVTALERAAGWVDARLPAGGTRVVRR